MDSQWPCSLLLNLVLTCSFTCDSVFRSDSSAAESAKVTLPVYLNPSRAQLLFTLDFSVDGPVKNHSFYERGVALTCSKLG